jgi:hypothetical protein
VPLLVFGSVQLVRSLRPVPSDRLAAAQLRYLRGAVAGTASERMASLFPEGAEFTVILTALADLDLAERGVVDAGPALHSADRALALVDLPATRARFGVTEPPGGVFLAGWALHIAVRRAGLAARAGGAGGAGTPADTQADAPTDALADAPTDALADAIRRGGELQAAVQASVTDRNPFLTSYPGQSWPVDNVVALAGLSRLDALAPQPDRTAVLTRWRAGVIGKVDPELHLLPHRTDSLGAAAQGPRASSSALIAAFWPDAFGPDVASSTESNWRAFVDAFVVRRAGLVGVLEYPRGSDGESGGGSGDVDSGPLVLGVSLSASAVALAGARRNGDRDLESALQREAELVGLPIGWPGGRRYAGGVLPVGDAFLAWARGQPRAPARTSDGTPRALLWPWPAALLVLGAMPVTWAVRRLRRGTR